MFTLSIALLAFGLILAAFGALGVAGGGAIADSVKTKVRSIDSVEPMTVGRTCFYVRAVEHHTRTQRA